MTSPAQPFLSDETGAVTVDWVVLTAALVGLGLAVMAVISSGLEDLSGDVSDVLERDDIIQVSFASGYSAFYPETYDAIVDYMINGDPDSGVPDEASVRDQFAQYVSDAETAIANGDRDFAEYYMDSAAAVADAAGQRGIGIDGGDADIARLQGSYAGADFGPAS
jgi:hypothetical protein